MRSSIAGRGVRPAGALTLAQARRIAIAAQGLAEPRPTAVDRRHLKRTGGRLGVVQIDSVNVLVRSHFLPLFARLGPYSRPLLGRSIERHRDFFEYWGHAASLLPIDLQPCLRWRMARASATAWGALQRVERERPGYVQAVLDEVRERGPIAASDLHDGGTGTGPWWGWAEGKTALEWLFWAGEVTAAGRRPSFERVYDVPERVLPAAVLAAPTPPVEEARRTLVLRAVRALGVGTAKHVADYYRMAVADTRRALAELVEAGAVVPVAVGDSATPWYLDPAARRPRQVAARALLSPFDSLVWERARTETLFGFRYRIEVYTPAPKRVYGYYVLPFLLGDSLVARVDLKADRASATLRVQASWLEPGAPAEEEVAAALTEELAAMASWLELDGVTVAERGDLAAPLRRAFSASRAPRA